MDLAKRIAENRMNCNLSQSDLAARLFVSRDLVSKWETGARRPDWQMIGKIADALHIPVSDLVDKNELVYRELEMCLPKESSLSVEELIPLLNLFLEGLQETKANIFIRRYYFLDSILDIALSHSLSEGHIRSILSRTRKKLKIFLKEAEYGKHKNV